VIASPAAAPALVPTTQPGPACAGEGQTMRVERMVVLGDGAVSHAMVAEIEVAALSAAIARHVAGG